MLEIKRYWYFLKSMLSFQLIFFYWFFYLIPVSGLFGRRRVSVLVHSFCGIPFTSSNGTSILEGLPSLLTLLLQPNFDLGRHENGFWLCYIDFICQVNAQVPVFLPLESDGHTQTLRFYIYASSLMALVFCKYSYSNVSLRLIPLVSKSWGFCSCVFFDGGCSGNGKLLCRRRDWSSARRVWKLFCSRNGGLRSGDGLTSTDGPAVPRKRGTSARIWQNFVKILSNFRQLLAKFS